MLIPSVPSRSATGILDLAKMVPLPPGFSDDPVQRIRNSRADFDAVRAKFSHPEMHLFHLQPTAFMQRVLPPPSQYELAMRYFQY